MPALKILLYVIVGLGLLLIILAAIAPKEMRVERTAIINARPESVFLHLRYYENRLAWYPWFQMDPNLKTTIEGEDGVVGTIFRWEGNKKVGKGEQELLSIVPNQQIRERLTFTEPYESDVDTWYQLRHRNGATELKWGFQSPIFFPFNILAMVWGMEKGIARDYDKGLENLKQIVKSAAVQPETVIEMIEFSETHYVHYRQRIPFGEMEAMIQNHTAEIRQALGAAGKQPIGPMTNLYFEWDEANQATDMAVAFPVAQPLNLSDVYTNYTVPSGKAVRYVLRGGYDKLGDAHMAIDDYLKANDLEARAVAIEEYLVSQEDTPDPKGWITNIIYPVQ